MRYLCFMRARASGGGTCAPPSIAKSAEERSGFLPCLLCFRLRGQRVFMSQVSVVAKFILSASCRRTPVIRYRSARREVPRCVFAPMSSARASVVDERSLILPALSSLSQPDAIQNAARAFVSCLRAYACHAGPFRRMPTLSVHDALSPYMQRPSAFTFSRQHGAPLFFHECHTC